jgi:hypothetical protein
VKVALFHVENASPAYIGVSHRDIEQFTSKAVAKALSQGITIDASDLLRLVLRVSS